MQSFPNARIAIVTVNKKIAGSIAEKHVGVFHVTPMRHYSQDELDSRVVVGTCEVLNQQYWNTSGRDLILLTDPKLCSNVMCDELFWDPAANPMLFVLRSAACVVSLKTNDRVLQYVGLDSVTIGPNNHRQCSVRVEYARIDSNPQAPHLVNDDVGLLWHMELYQPRNKKIAAIARRHAARGSDSMTIVVCAVPKHAKAIHGLLSDWDYKDGSSTDPTTASAVGSSTAAPAGPLRSTVRNTVCTSDQLPSLSLRGSRITIIWAGLRSETIAVPGDRRWISAGQSREIVFVDIEDYISRPKTSSRSSQRSTVSEPRSSGPDALDPLATLAHWNACRREQYESPS